MAISLGIYPIFRQTHIFVLAPRNVAPLTASRFSKTGLRCEVSFLEQLAFIAQHIHDDVAQRVIFWDLDEMGMVYIAYIYI